MLNGSSTPNVSGGMFNNSQGDQTMSTFNNCTLCMCTSTMKACCQSLKFYSDVGSDTMGSSLTASETVDALVVQACKESLGLNKLQMDSKKHSTNPHLRADTTSTSMDNVEYVDFNHVFLLI